MLKVWNTKRTFCKLTVIITNVHCNLGVDTWWPHDFCACLLFEGSGFMPWPETLCCILGQDTFLAQCLSPPRCINRRTSKFNAEGSLCDGLASHPGGSRNTPSRFMLQKPGISASLMGYLTRMQTLQ